MEDRQLLWWQTGVVYQIYPRSFQDSNGDGIGDLSGIIARLDYLCDLGIDAIWLSPFYPSPMADFGYDVKDYVNVDPIFGTLDDFDRLVVEAHRRGLRIIIDFVPNHTSEQHPWFLESRSSRDNPKRDWYVWRDARPDGSLPNNWLSYFGGSMWEWDETTRQYYLHSFLKEQPDLNWRNPQVEEAVFASIRFWLERDVDGFRLDVAHLIMKDPDLRDNPLNPAAPEDFKSMGDFDRFLHIHDKGHPDVHAVYRRFRKLLDAYSEKRPRYSVGEIHIFDWAEWATYYGALDELHMPFNFSLLFVPWNAEDVRKRVDALESCLPPGAWPNYVLGNHDEHRLASRLGREPARLAAMLLLTLRGTPTLYYGDELGMCDVEIPLQKQQDPWGKRVTGLGLGRDPERTPMQWNTRVNAGFCDPGVEPWLPVAEGPLLANVEQESTDPTSFLNLYRSLLRLRRSLPALHCGDYQAVDVAAENVYMFKRWHAQQSVWVVLNFAADDRVVTVGEGRAQICVSTHMDREGSVDLAQVTLRPYEGLVISL